jgi:hypothetical protein
VIQVSGFYCVPVSSIVRSGDTDQPAQALALPNVNANRPTDAGGEEVRQVRIASSDAHRVGAARRSVIRVARTARKVTAHRTLEVGPGTCRF